MLKSHSLSCTGSSFPPILSLSLQPLYSFLLSPCSAFMEAFTVSASSHIYCSLTCYSSPSPIFQWPLEILAKILHTVRSQNIWKSTISSFQNQHVLAIAHLIPLKHPGFSPPTHSLYQRSSPVSFNTLLLTCVFPFLQLPLPALRSHPIHARIMANKLWAGGLTGASQLSQLCHSQGNMTFLVPRPGWHCSMIPSASCSSLSDPPSSVWLLRIFSFWLSTCPTHFQKVLMRTVLWLFPLLSHPHAVLLLVPLLHESIYLNFRYQGPQWIQMNWKHLLKILPSNNICSQHFLWINNKYILDHKLLHLFLYPYFQD